MSFRLKLGLSPLQTIQLDDLKFGDIKSVF